MNQAYIYESSKNSDFSGPEALIILPDIYCQTDYSKKTTEEFSVVFKKPAFLLDYFYIYTQEENRFSENDQGKVHDLMQNFKGEDFVVFFKKTLAEIKQSYPNITSFSVIGFCFGGRLSYMAGAEDNVFKIFSFYGPGANTPNYVGGQSPLEYLTLKKGGSNLQVVSFFGLNDPTIPEEDRMKIREIMKDAGIDYVPHEYEAGHAYFQEGRKNYNERASLASWNVLKSIFGN